MSTPATRATDDLAVAAELVPATRFAHVFRAMRHRNYRLFFWGQGVSVIGNWMTRTATGWLVYRLTGSAEMLGIVGFASQIPSLIFAVFAGVWIERMDRRKLMTVTQVLACVQSFALAALVLTHHITMASLITLSVFQGLITAFDSPARQSFLVEMVDGKEDLGNAIALTSSLVTLARLVGPAIAGFIIAGVGEGWCFFLDGLSYVGVVISLLMMHIKSRPISKTKTPMLEQLREGWTYVSNYRPIRVILLVFALVSLMGMPYIVLLPIFAGTVLHGGPHTLGFLSGAAGLGALISSVLLALRKSVRGLTSLLQSASIIFGAGLIGLGLSRTVWLSIPIMVVTGFGMMLQMAASNTVIQTLVPEDKRSRVMSYYAMAFIGMTPVGSLLAGTLASRIGAPHTVIVSGIFCFLGALWFAIQQKRVRQEIRLRYDELGV